MNLSRLVTSGGMIIFAVAVIAGGTGAFFSDTETSSGNVFTAGSVTIDITSIDHTYNGDSGNAPVFDTIGDGFSFSLTDLKPLDSGNVNYVLDNGENEAYVCALVEETGNNENVVLDPETDAGDTADNGAGFGELGDFLSFKFGTESGTLANISGVWQSLGVVAANNPTESTIDYCFGEYDGDDCVLDEDAVYNLAQTDGLTADVRFYAVQTRNNPDFQCGDLSDIGNGDLFVVNDRPAAELTDKWFFYNDSNDTIMSLNQFGPTGENRIVTGPDGVGAAKMVLHDAGARYNIATYQFSDVKLSDIDSLEYRIYDASASAQTPFLHFNVDFNNSDTWQGRLVQVPSGVTEDTWTTVDALASTWTKTSGNWPVGVNTAVPFSGATPRTWADILADYPNAETRSTDAFLGVRVGHPGPASEESYVDWIEFDNVLYDFDN